MGFGDLLTTQFSTNLYRSPFAVFEGLSYTYSNIGGSFINATVGYNADNTGNRNLLLRFDRSFLTNLTKWAGGAYTSWEEDVSEMNADIRINSDASNVGIWLGRAYLLKGPEKTSRAVLTAAVYRKDYSSRPTVTIDSNRVYYNRLQVLTALSVSGNNYYLTDFIRDFGKIENLPYGHLFQLTVGADQVDFYTRLYTGMVVSAGNFFDKFGYLSASIKFGGFFNHSSFEDAVVKCNLRYFTPLLKTTNKKYKFRTFFSGDYRYAFNSRSNNFEDYDANLDFKIDKIYNPSYFSGSTIISGKIESVCYTPWYFYGFHVAVMMNFQAGVTVPKKKQWNTVPLFSGLGFSLIIKNDNLIFPAFVVSGYFYPSAEENFRQLQFTVGSNLNVQYHDFNVGAPYEETIAN
ncbi:MAG: hypothetical protein NTW16_04890 [Bacteroidetes bacterium]|nr:hypothetical protein [Bacteroidota bacterium]